MTRAFASLAAVAVGTAAAELVPLMELRGRQIALLHYVHYYIESEFEADLQNQFTACLSPRRDDLRSPPATELAMMRAARFFAIVGYKSKRVAVSSGTGEALMVLGRRAQHSIFYPVPLRVADNLVLCGANADGSPTDVRVEVATRWWRPPLLR